MTSKSLQFLMALVLCLTLAPATYAKGGHGNGGGDKHGDKDKHHDRVDRDHDRDGDHDRDDDDKRPAGWDKGKKKGWGDCDVPPGQVKKLGCHPDRDHHARHHDRDHDRDRDHHAYDRDRDRDRDHHASTTTKPAQSTTTTTVKKTTTSTSKVPAQTREQARRTGGKVYNDDGTWHYGGATQTAQTTTKK